MDKKNTVIEQMLAECSFFYRSGRCPIIYLDTEDLELVKRIALRGGITGQFVALEKKELKANDSCYDYYTCFHFDPYGLSKCVNFSENLRELELYAHSGVFQKLDIDNRAIHDRGISQVPFLFLFHVGSHSWSGLENLEAVLRRFVSRYLEMDPQSVFHQSCVLLYGDITKMSNDLKSHIAIVEEPYPQVWELSQMLNDQMKAARVGDFENEDMYDRIAEDLKGLSILSAERLIQSILRADELDGRNLIYHPEKRTQIIRNKKREAVLRHGGILELVEQSGKQDSLCGMERYLAWLTENKDRMEDIQSAVRRGSRPLKGCLFCGPPGCGKSEAGRLMGNTWTKLPLVKMNMDQLMGGLVGDSERNLRLALLQAEALAPAIIWMDEVDKALAGASADNKHDSTFQRMFSRLLQWMQNNDKGCFVFATANDISKLPPEFMRAGRFDKLWAVYLPTQAQCIKMFQEQMERAQRRRSDEAAARGQAAPGALFSMDCFSKGTMETVMGNFGEGKYLTGASIEVIVTDALNMLNDTPIRAEQWKAAIKKAAEETNTDISSPHNYHQVAANYIRLLRGSFVPVAEDNDLLFRPKDYQVISYGDDITVTCKENDSALATDYDKALCKTIKEIIDRRASAYERCLQDQEFSVGMNR